MDSFIGEIRSFAFNYVPQGWLQCDGTQYSRNSYPMLAAVLGTLYGGDANNFKVPNLKGRTPVASGTGSSLTPRQIGQTFGGKTVTIVDANMPQHSHDVTVQTGNADVPTPDSACYLAAAGTFVGKAAKAPIYNNAAPALDKTLEVTAVSPLIGGTVGHENRQPYLTMNMCICWDGVYPTPP